MNFIFWKLKKLKKPWISFFSSSKNLKKYQQEEYVYVARSNAEWDVTLGVNGEMLMTDEEVQIIKEINTIAEMSAGSYCTIEGHNPNWDDGTYVECCAGTRVNEETELCETGN